MIIIYMGNLEFICRRTCFAEHQFKSTILNRLAFHGQFYELIISLFYLRSCDFKSSSLTHNLYSRVQTILIINFNTVKFTCIRCQYLHGLITFHCVLIHLHTLLIGLLISTMVVRRSYKHIISFFTWRSSPSFN